MAIFIAAFPFFKMLNRPEASRTRFVSQVLEGAAKPVDGDASATIEVTTPNVAIDGANAGYEQRWLLLLTTPRYDAVQFACATIGRISNKGGHNCCPNAIGENRGRSISLYAPYAPYAPTEARMRQKGAPSAMISKRSMLISLVFAECKSLKQAVSSGKTREGEHSFAYSVLSDTNFRILCSC
ncbi:MAG TPA: hypothetical protein VHZ51_17195 [Ktedonobacteraceae bacterium]|nr:hypothetical protein [Ktedonobacteraceae bacterium]